MALSHRMELRQAQSLVMTPQLLQAIKLLQLSHLELTSWINDELERNPFLEAETGDGPGRQELDLRLSGVDNTPAGAREATDEPGDRPWDSEQLETSREALAAGLGEGVDNTFEPDGPAAGPADVGAERATGAAEDQLSVSSSLPGVSGGGRDSDDFDPLALLPERPDLHEHLRRQLGLALSAPADLLIGAMLIDAVTDAGYLDTAALGWPAGEEPAELAERLGAAPADVERVLAVIQGFEPPGVAARDLAECLAIQLREKNRYDPAMALLLSRLDLVAKRDRPALRRLCGVDDEDLTDMLAEIRALEPKPGRPFVVEPIQTLAPDVFVRAAADGSWMVELNSDALPRVLVNQAYYNRVARNAGSESDKSFLSEAWQNASWLSRSLDQRARTILKVASEIVRLQDGFFTHGVSHLRPLNLKTVADAIGMHESTVSRVTSNKAIGCRRGVFEMKYFFSTSIGGADGGDAHSAEAVRRRVKQMIDAEAPEAVLSDDAIVRMLRADGVDIARRTVAKYRESLRIPSSVDRRRLKSGQ